MRGGGIVKRDRPDTPQRGPALRGGCRALSARAKLRPGPPDPRADATGGRHWRSGARLAQRLWTGLTLRPGGPPQALVWSCRKRRGRAASFVTWTEALRTYGPLVHWRSARETSSPKLTCTSPQFMMIVKRSQNGEADPASRRGGIDPGAAGQLVRSYN